MSNILLIGGGTQGLAFAGSLAKSGHRVCLMYSDRHNYADASRYVNRKVYCKYPPCSEEYLSLLRDTIRSWKIDAVIPMGDDAAEMLSRNRDELIPLARFIMPERRVFEKSYNKGSLMSFCMENGFPHPRTWNSSERDLPFPVLIKPDITCGGRGMTLVRDLEELETALPGIVRKFGPCHLQEYVRQGGAQVEFQLLLDEKQKLVNSSVIHKYRWYPEKGGSASCAVSARDDKMVALLYELLRKLGWVGFADFDTIENPDTGELLILELNPRVPACVKTAMTAGIDWPNIIVDAYLGLPQKQYGYREGEFLRHLGFEVLWFIKSADRFRTKPDWFKFIGKHIHYQDMSDWTDPVPFIIGTLKNIRKVLRRETHS